MYSIVLLTAMTATPDTPQFNGYFRDLFHGNNNSCNGCNGCNGAARYSCSGCSGSTALTTSCNGCCGGSVFGWGLGDRVRSWFDRDPNGCCGGRSYNCTGSSFASGCCGGTAYSCFGGPATSYTPVFSGGLSCQGGFPMTAPAPMFDTPGVPGAPYAVPVPAPESTGMRSAAPSPTTALTASGSSARATVIVRLPVDARLYAESRELKLTGAERKFVSPELPVDQEFVYRFKAEYERDGETVSVTKRVAVRAGATATVEFVDLTASAKPTKEGTGTATATGLDKLPIPPITPTSQEPTKAEPPIKPANPTGDRATITVKLPSGATLYVDDRKSPTQEPVRSFTTPPLPGGREFAYVLKAEVIRNGLPETLTQKVPFRAGDRITVDFTSLGK